MAFKSVSVSHQPQMAELIAPCGMNCALCMAYQRQKNHFNGCNLDNNNKPKRGV